MKAKGTASKRSPALAPLGGASPGEAASELYWRSRLGLGALTSWRVAAAAWIVPLVVGLFAFVLRTIHLGHPHSIVFDETYYIKDAYTLWQNGYESEWADGANEAFARGDFSGAKTSPSFVVHPAVGKLMIALGLQLFGPESSFGWRFGAALTGTLTVVLLTWLAARLFHNQVLGAAAGLFLALDGQHLVQSRTSLLDIFLTFWVLVAMVCIVVDRDVSRGAMARDLARHGGITPSHYGPRTGVRWWLIGAGVAFGLACGVKWSGLYMLAAAGLLVLGWELGARRAVGVRRWEEAGIVRGGIPAFFALVGVAALTYTATWLKWFSNSGAYKHGWAAAERLAGREPWTPSFLPDAIADWLDYHKAIYTFHVGVTSEHSYMSSPFGWLLQLRPTSFYWPDDFSHRAGQTCASDRCVEAILAIGNVAVWWLGAAALLLVLWGAIFRRDWRAWLILAAYGGLYLPWFQYLNRTIFTFYTVVLSPWVCLALTYAVALLCQWLGARRAQPAVPAVPESTSEPAAEQPAAQSTPGAGPLPAAPVEGATWDQAVAWLWAPTRTWRARQWALVGGVTALVVAVAWFFWPIWVGDYIPYEEWQQRMWSERWI
ncbi:dolichyl-phosphate-mannose--protein mannosyltransferase [Buchananella hordeovulneris]|uniref:dolichyl-phosphate-mannose--protein mannosyltransferase n=1 Tax=Buchananella hordeovulneris TaxID=52770 RepID=UPI000F5ECAB8|nr:phospholipid carrier-dependent glycosyltransferase [Buchananella hordeovulneris]RRD41973.1 phospholipid carrier-dependent glycosyltransferase [Buchananella hordeovulneris]